MALESFNAYHSYLKAIEPLNEAERGRLFTACLEYSMTGVTPELKGNERFVFPSMAAQIDRDKEKYASRCRKNSENVSKRWSTNVYDGTSRIRTDTNYTKDKDKDKDKDYISPLSPNGDSPPKGAKKPGKAKTKNIGIAIVESWTEDPELRELLFEWLEIRKKRRAPETEGAISKNLEKMPDMAQKSGLSLQDYMREVIRRGWLAFYPVRDTQKKNTSDGGGFDWLTGK